MFHQHLAPFCLGGIDVITFLVGVLGGDAERCRTTVNLGNDDTGILGAAAHGDILVEPFFMGHSHGERTEQGDVLLLHPLDECVVAQASHRHIDNGIRLELVEHLLTFLACAGHGIDIEPLLRQHGDECVHMFAITLHGEGDTGYQGNRLGPFMIEMTGFQILRQFIGSLEITAVLTMVVHVFQNLCRLVVCLFAPALWCGDMSQVSETIAEVLTVLVVEVFLEGGYLLFAEVVVLHEVIAAQRLGIDGDTFLCHPLHLSLLLWCQEQPTGIDHHSIIVFETAHLLSLDAVHLDLRMVVAQYDVCLLGFQGIHDDNPCGCHEMAMGEIAGNRQYSQDANHRKNPSTSHFSHLFTFSPFQYTNPVSLALRLSPQV